MKIADAKIVGAIAAPRGKAAFDRAPLVVTSTASPGTFLQVRAYVGAEDVEGKELGQSEWDALVRSAQGISVEPMDLASGAALWVLRPSFERREEALEELRMSGVLVADKQRGEDGSFFCVVREPDANVMRDGWAKKAFEAAVSWGRDGQWVRALEAATRSFVLERALSAERIAMLSLAYEKSGNRERATAYLAMARRSRGAAFEQDVVDKRDALVRGMEDAPKSGDRPAMHKAKDNYLQAGLKRLSRRQTAA